jgi:hypothetical protein
MHSSDKDSSFWQVDTRDWICNADASTLNILRDNRHRNRWAMGPALVNLISVCEKSKLSRHFIREHLSNKFT